MKIRVIESCGSTNEELKGLLRGMRADHLLPPAILALEQTAGKGRSGRNFSSPAGKGLYLSVPFELASMEEALPIMPMASVCVCRTIEALCPAVCGIKWPNDLILEGRKVCGILTELMPPERGLFLVLGIGVNLSQEEADFPPELRNKAISIKQACGTVIEPQSFAEALLPALETMIKALPKGKAEYLDYYRKKCITTGKSVNVLFGESSVPRKAEALEITEDFKLLVTWENGDSEALTTGEVSIR